MGKLYIRLLGIMVLFMLISIGIQELVVTKVTEIAIRDDMTAWERARARERLRPIFRFTEAALRQYPEEEWAERFVDYRGYFVYPAYVVSLEEAAMGAEEGRKRIRSGGIWMSERPEGGWLASARLGVSGQGLTVTRPEPPGRREVLRRLSHPNN